MLEYLSPGWLLTDLLARLSATLAPAYIVERELGGGGMSRVFIARDSRLARRVVVKVLPPGAWAVFAADRFEREIRVAASLQHPHLVPVLSAGATDDLVYFIMPLIEGETLARRLAREGALPVHDVVCLLRDVTDALAYAHARGIVHRDVKPDNILLDGRHALVMDFGVAKAIGSAAEALDGSLTATGLTIGTPTYMAPEQAAGDGSLDHRADIYALGVVAYEMLSGRPPFTAPTPQAMLAAHVALVPEFVGRYRTGIPAELAALVMRCLEKHPADRWQSADELLVRLDVLRGRNSVDPSVPVARTRSVRAAGTSRWPLARIALLGVALATLLAVGYGGARLLGMGDVPTLLSAGRLEESDRLVLAELVNRTSDSTLGTAVTEALRVDLGQARIVSLINQSQVADVLERMGLPRETVLGERLAREVAIREGAKAVVAGDVTRLGSGYVLTARIVTADSGATLSPVRVTAVDDGDLIAAVNRLSTELRAGIGETLERIRAGEPLARVTTASLPALRLYTDAQRTYTAGRWEEAERLLERATETDTAFALAWTFLASVYRNNGNHGPKPAAATRRAFEHRDRLPTIQRHMIEAQYFTMVDGQDRTRPMAAYGKILEVEPEHTGALTNLSNLLRWEGRAAEAEAMARRAMAAGGPLYLYANLARDLAAQQKGRALDSLERHLDSLAPPLDSVLALPDSLQPELDRLRLFVGLKAAEVRRDYGRMERIVAAREGGDGGLPRGSVRLSRIGLEEIHGRFHNAARIAAEVRDSALAEGDYSSAAYYALFPARYAILGGDVAGARQLLARAVADPKYRRVPESDLNHYLLASQYAEIGDLAGVRRVRISFEELNPPDAREPDHEVVWGAIEAQAAGRWREAAVAYGVAAAAYHCSPCWSLYTARMWDREGEADSAIVHYRRAADRPNTANDVEDQEYYPVALRRLGDLYAARGDNDEALTWYGRFVTLWGGADPELQPHVRYAREQMTRLNGESRGQRLR